MELTETTINAILEYLIMSELLFQPKEQFLAIIGVCSLKQKRRCKMLFTLTIITFMLLLILFELDRIRKILVEKLKKKG
ncbi:MAG: hypothetical protein UU71_C0016G0016 [Parcubacteria group bacterium GW2011_GWB1_41_6]|nr:MAG: hypothetical protein UU71_C0016G0016 [Parcubacteria group bacterium GW2011_GWB1_41_6]KKS33640.1 MAG: hypothetical protein UU96_C0018G0010 [Parcubacteria group bacterium GW2011_GWC2_42_13]KKS56378.1 MAG: hypothetical protein UV22_C0033G0006 [Parcubacteria group bacterium GW2011_GWA2_42_35]KKS70339.1 MAG: hypothetical protein UV43_C0067G0005 [Parcubacteria group bacterium GW2011_GWF2_42_7]